MLLVLPLAGAALSAQEAGSPTPAITTVGEFWNVPAADRAREHPLRMTLVVYHYDASWKLLYGETEGAASFMPVRGRSLSMKAGQKVRLEGTVIPAEGIDGDRIKATVLADDLLPEPRSLAGRMADIASVNGRWVTLEGLVLSQVETDATHVDAKLWSEGRLVGLNLMISGTEPVPQLVGARVRVEGVYDVLADSAGGLQNVQLWSAKPDRLKVLGWLADDERFKLPRTPIERLSAAAGSPWVRIAGTVKSRSTGEGLTVLDETGQAEIATAQPDVPPVGTQVEVVGRAAPAGLGWTLLEPFVRRHEGAAAQSSSRDGPGRVPMRLRLAEQVLQLTSEEAEKRSPVTLRGVVSWCDNRSDHFYLQDVSGGVAVTRPPDLRLEFGTTVTVIGVTVRGRLVPAVELLTIEQAGVQPLPPPRRISLDQALTGAEEGRWVEMRGHVRQVAPVEGWTRLDVTAPTGEFSAYLPAGGSVASLRGALVRLRGVCETQPGPNQELPEVRLWVQNREGVQVDEPAPADPFAAPLHRIEGLRPLLTVLSFNHRVRLAGRVLLHEPGRYLYLQDDSGGLFVLTREAGRITPGDWIEVAGFPGRAGNRLTLREAVWRRAPGEAGRPAAPQVMTYVAEPQAGSDARLVQIDAVLRQVVSAGGRANLTVQAGDVVFAAEVREAADWIAPGIGSQVELTGVYVIEYDEYRRPRGFRLELRAPADVRVLAPPPWWNAQRVWYAVGGLILSMGLVFSWVVVLRRRVREQTEHIRQQMEKEARLQTELERSSRLESLGVLAGGIAHDFNNLLTAILGNLGLAAMDKRVMAAAGDCIAEAERGARRARDITQQLLTFAKGGDPVRAAVPLPEIVTEAANFARHGSNVRFDFDFPSNLPPGDVDAGQISRVVHNLVINAVQAMPEGGVVSIALAAAELAAGEVGALSAGSYLRLTIADTGKGISPENMARIFDPYFSTKSKTGNSGLGLATVRSIIKKHNGHIEVDSRVGQGTTFQIWLPAAPHESAPAATAANRTAPHAPARILVMDDEEVIRRVAGRMLALAGHEAAFVADGGEAVRAYAAARQAGRPFDLVVFDLTVPGGMGGKEALQELLKIDPAIRAIASSGYSSDPIMANPHAYGFRSSLPKPYDIPDLLRVVEEARRH